MAEITDLRLQLIDRDARIAHLESVIRGLRMRLDDTEESLRLVNDEGIKAW